MGIAGIAAYVARAARFAGVVAAAYLLGRGLWLWASGRRPNWGGEGLRLLMVFYLAAVVEITALRGVYLQGFRGPGAGQSAAVQLAPLRTTLGQLRAGAWPFVYHVVGNLAWFMPLGALLPAIDRRATLVHAALAALCLSAAVEGAQWALHTGQPDVDDLMLNALGGGLGWLGHAAAARRGHRPGRRMQP
ncbi:MAG: hypothetical protein GX558_07135 [Clostridiales bacterium]|nr:hypothetical protein [Clostridiales bacterium]